MSSQAHSCHVGYRYTSAQHISTSIDNQYWIGFAHRAHTLLRIGKDRRIKMLLAIRAAAEAIQQYQQQQPH